MGDKSTEEFDWKQPLEVVPTVSRILTVGVGALAIFNGLLKIPVVGDGAGWFRKQVHSLLDFVGGKQYRDSEHVTVHSKDGAMDFAIDCLLTLGIAGMFRVVPGVADKLNQALHFIEKLPVKAIDALRGEGHHARDIAELAFNAIDM